MSLRRLLLAAALAGCSGIELVDPTPQRPSLALFIGVRHDSESTYRLFALLVPGRDASGQSQSLADSTLVVGGTPIEPVVAQGELEYEWTDRVSSRSSTDTIRVVLPVHASRPDESTEIALFAAARTDSSAISVSRGDDLRLHVSPEVIPAPFETGIRSWTLSLERSCTGTGSVLEIRGDGPYPAELRIPWNIVPSDLGDAFDACFDSSSSYVATVGAYSTLLNVRVEARWRIQIVRQ